MFPMITLVPWPQLPSLHPKMNDNYSMNAHVLYDGQMALQTECNFRMMGIAEMVAFVDFDDVIVRTKVDQSEDNALFLPEFVLFAVFLNFSTW